MMTSLTFYGGVNEVGGNKILLQDKDTKIFLDFGKSYAKEGKYLEGFVQPRKSNGLGDYIDLGLLPDINGLYRNDLVVQQGYTEKEADFQGVLISHAHSDHVDYATFLHKDIPLYMGKTTKGILQALYEIQGRRDREVLDFKEHGSSYRDAPIPRDIREFSSGKKFKIDSLEILPIHVDHSIPGSYGFIIYTSSGPVVYTGDLRLHGTKPQMTREFVDAAQKEKPIALIAEGTHINNTPKDESESKVFEDGLQVVSRSSGFVCADFNFRDVDRVRTFYEIAKRTNRKFVINLKNAPFLKYFHQFPELGIPNYTDPDVILCKTRLYTGTFQDSDYRGFAEYVCRSNTKTTKQIGQNPEKYLCAMGFYNFPQFIDMKIKSGTYIHSASEPWSEEQTFSVDRRNNWVDHFGMSNEQIHCSGHASRSDLFGIVQEINADVLYPIHSGSPKEYDGVVKNIVYPEYAKRYEL
jgi:ribonuclease J